MSSERRQVFLLHFTPVTTTPAIDDVDDDAVLRGLIDRIPDGFVALDSEGVVRHANQAFLDLGRSVPNRQQLVAAWVCGWAVRAPICPLC